MIREIDMNGDNIHLEYYQNDEKEILLNYLIKEYDLEQLDYTSIFDDSNMCVFIKRVVKTKRKYPIGKITECIREIEKYQDYKTKEVKKLFRTDREYVELSREEKLESMKFIIDRIKIIMNKEVFEEQTDVEFLKKELGL